MDFAQFIATSIALGVNLATTMFNAVFQVIGQLLPYGIGLAVLGIVIGICWRLIGRARLG